MTFFRRLFPHLIAVAALSASSFASAASIDFTASSPWSGANNQTTFSSGIATLTATASGGGIAPVMRFNSPGVCTGAAISLSCNGDGIGLYAPISVPFVGQVDLSPEIDRLGRNEELVVNFSHAVNITSIEVLNLFSLNLGMLSFNERFQVSINGGAYATYGGPNQTSGSGYFLQALNGQPVTSLNLRPDTSVLGNLASDFTLARITYSEVPEPSALALGLAGLGAIGLAGLRGRRRRG